MAKTYPYAVKYNGKYYPANTPIEEKAKKGGKKPEQSEQSEKAEGEKKDDAE